MIYYITSDELKATLTLSGQSYADEDVAAAIAAASAGVDLLCKRKGTTSRLGFQKDADATQVRYYTPESLYGLDVDDIVSIASVLTDPAGDGTFSYTWTANTDYSAEPLNAAADGWPYTRLTVRQNGTYTFPVGYVRSVKVTGQFGWPAVPDAIVQATTILASRLIKRARETPFAVVGVGLDGAAVRIAKSDPDIEFLVGPYMNHRISVA